MRFPSLPGLDANCSGIARTMNVCVVTSEFLGPVKNGGMGTATSGLVKQLVADGHNVTLLYTVVNNGRPFTGDKPWQYWVDELAAQGVLLRYIPLNNDWQAFREASWLVKDFISQNDFDVVYFNEHHGSGYYSLLAKQAGLAPFCNQLHCVITHGSMEWIFSLNDHYAHALSDIEWMGVERRSLELADVVIAPSTYLLRTYESYGWRLPAQTFHQPYPIFRNCTHADDGRRLPINEIVFFGRLEVRKGLWLFTEALDRLAERFPGITVTFLGKVTEFTDISSALQLVNRSGRWPFRVRLFTDFDQGQALSYLRVPGRLAVMPSPADNSPCVVYECIEAGIPFISTRGSGAEELVAQNSRDDVMVDPNVKSLAEKLAHILEHGARLGRPRLDLLQNLAAWSAWHRYIGQNFTTLLQTPSAVLPEPKRARIENAKAALIVIIDTGSCAISLLIDNLSTQMKRFGEHAAYLVLSARRGKLNEMLHEIFNSNSKTRAPPVCISDPETIEEARQLVCASAFVFFMNAETEMHTSFFVSALAALRQQEKVIISCAVAVRQNRNEIGELEELPTGDIPGLAALGEPVGGSVWAVAAPKFTEYLSVLDFYDPQLDTLAPSAALGQMLMQQCAKDGVPIRLLPVVGAVETRKQSEVRRQQKVKLAHHSGAILGVEQSIYRGGAPWYAISAFDAQTRRDEKAPVESSVFLPAQHPYTKLQTQPDHVDGEMDLVPLAATLARPDLSLQLAAAEGPRPGRLRHLIDVATRAVRLRPAWDLAELFSGENLFEFGMSPVPENSSDKADHASPVGQNTTLSARRIDDDATSSDEIRLPKEIGSIYADAHRLRIRRKRVQANTSLRKGGPGKIFIFDVPLCSHGALVAELRSSSSSDPLLVRMRVIDQRQGDEIGTSSARLIANKPAKLAISLHDVYGTAAIVIEFSGAEKMEVAIESLRLQ